MSDCLVYVCACNAQVRISLLGDTLQHHCVCEVCTDCASHNSKHAILLHHFLQQLVAVFNPLLLAGNIQTAHEDCKADAAMVEQPLLYSSSSMLGALDTRLRQAVTVPSTGL